MPRDDDAGRKPSWSTVSRLAHLFPPPPPKFLGDFRADASDTDEESLEAGSEPGDDARRGRRASISAVRTTDEEKTSLGAPAVSLGLIAAVTAKTKARAEARAVAEARAEAARRITEAAERAEEDKKARNRALVESFRAASRAAAAAATSLRFERKSERAAARDKREEIAELWAAELAFEGATNETFSGSGDRPSFGSGTTETKNKPRSPPPTKEEARLHAAYARRETRDYGIRCAKCDAGASHSAAECDAISEALKKTSFFPPRVPPPPGFAEAVTNTEKGDVVDAKSAARACSALLLQRRTRSETQTWFANESPLSARLGFSELRLERRGLGPSLPSLNSFFALTFLDVSRNRLSCLPENLGDTCPLLETIDASANKLVALPASLGGLFFLKKLVARSNRLATLPSLAGARALEHLDVSSNASLRTLPNDLVVVKTLRELIADGCVFLSSLPEALGEAQDDLKTVRARRCRLTKCPEGVSFAISLETLDLGSNSIAFLPDALGGAQQPSLRVVRVDDNLLRRLPRGLKCAAALEIFDCSSNALRDVAPLVGCGSLVDLNVADNAIAEMPRDLAGGPERARAAHEAKRLGLERARQVMTLFSRAAAERAQDAGGGGTRDGTPPSGAAPAPSPADAGDTEASGDAERSRRRARKAREKEKARRKLDEAERAAAAAALANASRVVGLRRLRAANNRLTRLPPCLGATLAVGGAGGRVVDLRGNPLDPPVLRMLAERNGVDAYVDRLASTHADTTRLSLFAKRRVLEDAAAAAETIRALRREAYDSASVTRRFSGEVSAIAISAETSRGEETRKNAFFVSREAPGRLTRLRSAGGSLTQKEKTRTNERNKTQTPRHRRLSVTCGESRDAVFASRVACDARFAERLASLENARASAVAARARAVSQRARRSWRLAIFSVLKRLTSSQARAVEAVEGFARREAFRETVSDASRRAKDAERSKYAWILDAPSPLAALPHRLRCALARKCRAHVASQNETVWNAGDDGDFAVVVVEGACALVDDPTDVEDVEDDDASSIHARDEFGDAEYVADAERASIREFPPRTWGPRLVVSAEYVLAQASASGSKPPARPGARACAGTASLLTGDPRRLTLRVIGARARYYAIPRRALAEVLNEDDAARASEFRERRARVAAAARTAACDLFASIDQLDVSRTRAPSLSGASSSVKSGDSASEKEQDVWTTPPRTCLASRASRASRSGPPSAEIAETEARLAEAETAALEEHARASRLNPPARRRATLYSPRRREERFTPRFRSSSTRSPRTTRRRRVFCCRERNALEEPRTPWVWVRPSACTRRATATCSRGPEGGAMAGGSLMTTQTGSCRASNSTV
jgi:Leucine-rich repeat (LRR) protein